MSSRGGHKNNNESTAATSDFVETWLALKQRLLAMEPGTMKSKHWNEAQELLTALRTHPSFTTVPTRVQGMFEVLDRLSVEMMHQVPAKEMGRSPHFDNALLDSILVAWRNYIELPTLVSSKAKQSEAERFSAATILPNNLQPTSVVTKVEGYMSSGLFGPAPNPYGIIMDAIAKVESPRKAPSIAEDLHKAMLKRCFQNPLDKQHHPTNFTVYHLVNIWAQSWLPESPSKAESYLQAMKQWFGKTGREDLKPTTFLLCAVMEAHGRSSEPGMALNRIQELVLEMKNTCSEQMDIKSYTRVCNALASCKHPYSADAARAVLDELCRDWGIRKPEPDGITFLAVMTAYARAKRAKEAQELFDFMERFADQTGEKSLLPDLPIYGSLMWAYAGVGDTKGVENVLSRLLEARKKGQRGLELGIRHWNSILTSWAESNDPDAPSQVMRVIDRIRKLALSQNWDFNIDTHSLNALLITFARQGTTQGAQVAEKLFVWMEGQTEERMRPNRDSCLSIITAWCNAGDPQRAELFLYNFVERIQQGKMDKNILDQQHFNVVVESWSTSKHPQAAERARFVFESMRESGIQPNTVSFTSLIWAWAKSSTAMDPCKQVEHLYEQMKKQWKGGDTFAKPDERTYNAVLWALSRTSNQETLGQTEDIFQEMDASGVPPDAHAFNTVMSGWLKHNQPEKVEAMFQEAKKQFGRGVLSMRPCPEMHATRLHAWSRAGNPEITVEALNEWISVGEAQSFDNMPGTQAFNAVLHAWSRTHRPNAALQAEKGLTQMFELARSGRFRCHPDHISFTIVISAYAKSRSADAGKRALHLFKKMKSLATDDKHMEPTLITYAELITTLARSSENKAEKAILDLLKELQTKEESFWTDGGVRVVECMGKIRHEIRSSIFLDSKRSLFEALDQITPENQEPDHF